MPPLIPGTDKVVQKKALIESATHTTDTTESLLQSPGGRLKPVLMRHSPQLSVKTWGGGAVLGGRLEGVGGGGVRPWGHQWSGCNVRIRLQLRLPHSFHCPLSSAALPAHSGALACSSPVPP